ncbi:hypothetical protein [Pseudomonas sp. S2_A10]
MSYAYEELATVGVPALYQEQPPNTLTTLELNIRLLNVGSGRFRVEFDRYLQDPKEASAVQVMLTGGLLLQGPIVDGSNEPAGSWLLIDVEQAELPFEPPATSTAEVGVSMDDGLAALYLPHVVQVETLELLARPASARRPAPTSCGAPVTAPPALLWG